VRARWYFVHTASSRSTDGNLLQRLVRVRIGTRPRPIRGRARAGAGDFVGGAFDVLLATTIIRERPRIPNATRWSSTGPLAMGSAQSTSCVDALAARTPCLWPTCSAAADGLPPVARKRLAAIKDSAHLGSPVSALQRSTWNPRRGQPRCGRPAERNQALGLRRCT